MSKYYNLKGFQMNLQVTRYTTILVKCGVADYPDEIALKHPSIFQKVEEKKEVIKEVIEEKKEVDVEVIVEEKKEVKAEVIESISYDEMSYNNLKLKIKEANIIIDGRKTKSKMIDALMNRK